MSPVRGADDDRGPGLQDGEVVAFAVDGLPYVVDVENSRGGDAVRFGVSRLDDARSIASVSMYMRILSSLSLGFRVARLTRRRCARCWR